MRADERVEDAEEINLKDEVTHKLKEKVRII